MRSCQVGFKLSPKNKKTKGKTRKASLVLRIPNAPTPQSVLRWTWAPHPIDSRSESRALLASHWPWWPQPQSISHSPPRKPRKPREDGEARPRARPKGATQTRNPVGSPLKPQKDRKKGDPRQKDTPFEGRPFGRFTRKPNGAQVFVGSRTRIGGHHLGGNHVQPLVGWLLI